MAIINYKYSEEKVLYDSGEIEDILLKIYKENNPPSELEKKFFYPLSPIRENIINWYPFKKNSSILEVGGGLGSITGALCEEGGKVVSCEYSKRRAENIYYRHKNRDNLEVIVGNINNIKFKEKFDYIVLIGVFEYAKRFVNSEEPFLDFLNNLKTNLKEGGVILIAIENRYGIKYWAGDFEDHYPKKYFGLTGYDNESDIITMGKQELINIFEKSKLEYKFYYPYPDYKMPYLITTDEREFFNSEISSLKLYNHGEQTHNFDYRKLLPGIIKNQQYGFFANSFLVELTENKKNLTNISFVKTHWNRTQNYQINTLINNNNEIIKKPKYLSGINHLNKMKENHDKLKKTGIKTSSISKIGSDFKIEYIDGELLSEIIYDLVEKNKKDKIIREIHDYYNFLKSISYEGKMQKIISKEVEEFYANKKTDILKLGMFDLHCSNVIKQNNTYVIIDQEWVTDNDVPLKYMFYFSLYYLFECIDKLKNIISIKELLNKYNISENEITLFSQMSYEFSKEFDNNDEDIAKITESSNYVNIVNMEEITNKLEKIINSKRWKIINNIIALKEKIYKK